MNLFDLVIVRTAPAGDEGPILSWDCVEQQHVIPDDARLQVSFNPGSGRLSITAHLNMASASNPDIRLVSARLLSADEYGVTYAGVAATDETWAAAEVILTRNDTWNPHEHEKEVA